MRTNDEKIDAALDELDRKTMRILRRHDVDAIRAVMRDLLAGRFDTEPVPTIVPPPWPHEGTLVASVSRGEKGKYFLVKVEPIRDHEWPTYYGPERRTEIDAVKAWNAVFGK